MDRLTTTTQATISQGQLNALKATLRAGAETNLAGKDKGQRCAELTRRLCEALEVNRLADLPATAFPYAMNTAGKLATERQPGPIEASLKTARENLSPALADLNRTRHSIATFRHEIARALIAPLTDLFQSQDALCVAVQDTVGLLLAEPFLTVDAQLDRAHEAINVLASRLPAIGRALDELKAGTTTPANAFPNMGAD